MHTPTKHQFELHAAHQGQEYAVVTLAWAVLLRQTGSGSSGENIVFGRDGRPFRFIWSEDMVVQTAIETILSKTQADQEFKNPPNHPPVFDTALFFHNKSNMDSGHDASIPSSGLSTIVRIYLPEKKLEVFHASGLAPEQVSWTAPRLLHILHQISECFPSKTLISTLSVIGEDERAALATWGYSLDLFAEERKMLLHEMFEYQVSMTPENHAIQFENDAPLTYSRLNARANRLSRYLQQFGVSGGSLVPLCMDKCVDMVVAILAVLKAGAAWLPLDPENPVQRTMQILDAVKVSVILTTHLTAGVFEDVHQQVIVVDAIHTKLNGLCDTNLRPNMDHGGGTCHVLFTSGSTGVPKGVLIDHSAEVNNVCWMNKVCELDENSRTLNFAAYTFDICTLDIFMTLSRGGCLFMAKKDTLLSGITDFIVDKEINYTQLTPTVIRMVDPRKISSLKVLASSGEALSQDIVSNWSHVKLINAYGPTETIVCTVNDLRDNASPSCIGRPDCGMSTVILDEKGQQVPIGVVGELCISGPQVFNGYLNDPVKTRNSFFNTSLGIFYRTGDLASYDHSGLIFCRGRIGNQVKLRGMRVELEEIEHHLKAHPSVMHCAVVLPRNGPSKDHIVAVLSLKGFSASNANRRLCVLGRDLRETASTEITKISDDISKKFPIHMVPTIWLPMKELVFTATGKISRVAIKEWLEDMSDEILRDIKSHPGQATNSNMPKGSVEEKLQSIWSTVLNVPKKRISIDSSFLHLGGDSVSAIQVVSKCRQHNIRITVQQILRSRTISKLLPFVKDITTSSEYTGGESIGTFFDLSPIQQMHFELRPDGGYHYNQGFLVKLTRKTAHTDLKRAIENLVNHHSMLRARFKRFDSGWKQFITSDIHGSCTVKHYDNLGISDVKSIAERSQRSLNIQDGPVFSIDSFDTNNDGQLVFFTAHHLVVDLVSWRVILEDIENLLSGKYNLPKSLSFQSWVGLQNNYSNSMDLETAWPFETPGADYGFWGIGENNVFGDNKEISFYLDLKLTSLLVEKSGDALRTDPVDLMLSSMAYAFRRVFPERQSITAFNEGHGREPWDADIDLSRTVAWFTTMYPVTIPVKHSDTLVDVARRTKDIRRKIPNNGWSYFAMRYLHVNGREKYRKRPMELIFNYQGKYQQLERKDGLLQGMQWGELESTMSGPELQRYGLFEIEAAIDHGQLKIVCCYNKHMRHQSRILEWINSWENALRDSIVVIANLEKRQYTISDFPLLDFTEGGFQQFQTTTLANIGVSSLDDIDDACGCSPVQNGMAVAALKNPDLYKIRYVWEMHPTSVSPSSHSLPVDIELFKMAWRTVVEAHPLLRTILVEDPSARSPLVQVVLPMRACFPEVLVLSCNDEDLQAAFGKLKPIEHYAKKLPHRLAILTTSKNKVFCQLEISHLVTDGWSLFVLVNDLIAAYHGRLRPSASPPYSDLVGSYQRQSPNRGKEFWTNHLSGIEPCIFPILNESPKAIRRFGTRVIPLDSVGGLQGFCETNGLTLPTFFRAVWALILRWYVGNDSVCFTYTVSGRDTLPNTHLAVGPYMNMLVCRADMNAGDSAFEVLQQIQRTHLEALPYQTYSLGNVQQWAGIPSDMQLLNTGMTFEKYPGLQEVHSDSFSMKKVSLDDPSEFDLFVRVVSDEEVIVELDYWTNVISSSQAKIIAELFNTVVSSIIRDPHQPLHGIYSGSEIAKEQLSARLRQHDNIFREETFVHRQFEAQVLRSPERIALQFEDSTHLTYEQLNSRSNGLAKYLIGLGVKPEVRVAICLEKSTSMVITMLAILKAGGAYVPLNSEDPPSRLSAISTASSSKVIITTSDLLSAFDPVKDCHKVDIEKLTYVAEEQNLEIPGLLASNICYIIYTSGSTGKPKGVMLEHVSVSTALVHMGKRFGLNSSTRMLQFCKLTWDPSVFEIFGTMIHGGCIVIPSQEKVLSDLSGTIVDLNVNTSFLTPSVTALLDEKYVTKCLKKLIVGGEALPAKTIERLADKFQFMQGYGPTECSVLCSANPNVDSDTYADNIGTALAGAEWILGGFNGSQLIPAGCVGELCFSGPNLARGYLNDEAQTKTSFTSHPFLPGQRLYRTGDLARHRPDGSIQYIGRKDTQVKLNGQRIELCAIEFELNRYSENFITIVQTVRPEGRNPALIAFVAFRDQASGEGDNVIHREIGGKRLTELQHHAARFLPRYMVPSMWIPLKRLPMNSSHKTDRRALLNLVTPGLLSTLREKNLSHVKTGPSTPTEKLIQERWASILELNRSEIGVQDNFFQLGGDSLAVMVFTSTTRHDFGFSVIDVFDNPTISGLAAVAENKTGVVTDLSSLEIQFSLLRVSMEEIDSIKSSAANLCGVHVDMISDIYPCSPLQEGLVLETIKNPRKNIAQIVYRLRPETSDNLLRDAWEAVVKTNSILRTRIVPTQLGFCQVVLSEEDLHWQFFDVSESLEKTVDEHLDEDLTLDMGPGKRLVRFALFRHPKDGSQLIWTIHHALYDGISINLIIEDLIKAYSMALFQPRPSFKSFIHHLLNANESDACKFWTNELNGATPSMFPPLPFSYKPGTATISTHHLKVDVVAIATKCHSTPPSILRAAWALVAGLHSDSTEPIFGVVNSGRSSTNIANIDFVNGPCVVTMPLRVKIDRSQLVSEYLASQTARDRELMRFEYYGLQQIANINNDTKTACGFNTLFVVQNMFDHTSFENSASPLEHVQSRGEAGYPLCVECMLRNGGVEIFIHRDGDVISDADLSWLIGHFEAVLNSFHNPNTELGDINFLAPLERETIWDWSNQVLPMTESRSIYRIFEDQVRATPDAPAAQFEDHSPVTYSQLNEISNQIAHYLQHIGVQPESIIPICLDRNVCTIASMFGVMKAGCGYVALDPESPASRCRGIVVDCSSPVVITSGVYFHLFDDVTCNVLDIDTVEIHHQSRQNLDVIGSIAYILFTSGSTGKPKGVVMPHSAVVRSLHSQQIACNLGPSTRTLALSSFSFDGSVHEIFLTLLYGGCLCLASKYNLLARPTEMINLLQTTHTFSTPTVARLLSPKEIPTMKSLILGGEPINSKDIQTWAPYLRLSLGYGPTETCIFCCFVTEVSPDDDPKIIGKPIGGNNWILGPGGEILPVGGIGELHISGETLSAGYLNDPIKTAAAFIEHPHLNGQRLYKTGDYARWNSDGLIQFISRIDTQVKIHGLRIELGEIEYNLSAAMPNIPVVVDVLRSDIENPVLTAFINISSLVSIGEESLQKNVYWIEDYNHAIHEVVEKISDLAVVSLPRYMHPTVWVPVTHYPLTTSGKLDRKGLCRSFEEDPERAKRFIGMRKESKKQQDMPSTSEERLLLSFWSKILRTDEDQIGLSDDFFVLGGDSIAAIRLSSLCIGGGLNISVGDIFKNRTIGKLASTILQDTKGPNHNGKLEYTEFSLLPTGSLSFLFKEAAEQCGLPTNQLQDIYPCSPLQETLIALSVAQRGAYVTQQEHALPRSIDITRFKSAWNIVVDKNPLLRTRIIDTKSFGTLQVVVKSSAIYWITPMANYYDQYLVEDIEQDVSYGDPLLRFALFDMGKEGWRFVWTCNHALYDGTSMGFIFEEFREAYRHGKITQSRTPYPYFIMSLNDASKSAAAEFWTKELCGAVTPNFPSLPSSEYRPKASKVLCRQYTFSHSCSPRKVTIATIIRAAWAMVIARLTNTSDVCFGTTLLGRNAPILGIENVNGPTIVTLPVRMRIDGTLSVADFLDTVQTQFVDMMPFEQTGIRNIRKLSSDADGACAFNSLLIVQARDILDNGLGFDIKLLESRMQLTNAVNLECIPGNDGIKLCATYDNEVLDEAQMTRTMVHFETALDQFFGLQSAAKMGEIDIFGSHDRLQIETWNSVCPELDEKCIHQVIEAAVRNHPDNEAVLAPDGSFTYKELDDYASRLATHLAKIGVLPGDIIPMCFEKSKWAIVAIFSILKAGASYVGLDPSNPIARLQSIVEDTRPKLILSSPAQFNISSEMSGTVFVLDKSVSRLTLGPSPVCAAIRPKDIAYIIFTSGSTGKPKGVVMEHAAAWTSIQRNAAEHHIDNTSRLLQFSSFMWDVHVFEVFGALCFGGCVCIPSAAARLQNLGESMERMKVNWAFLTPTVATLLLPSQVPSLNTLALGGEPLTQDLVSIWSSELSLYNSYGPTETCYICIHNPIIKKNTHHANLGRAITGLSWIVDPENHEKLVPIGGVGELVISGPTLAQGYLGDLVKTNASFIDNPSWMLGIKYNKRIYKTGDLVRYNNDGSLQYLGRKDRQVKVRGIRIELGEIEHQLAASPLVSYSAIFAPNSGPCRQKIVAVMRLKDYESDTNGEIRLLERSKRRSAAEAISNISSNMLAKLPQYMVPNVWVVLQDIPILISGKADVKSLTLWLENLPSETYLEIISPPVVEDIVQPTTMAVEGLGTIKEKRLQRLWAQVLNLDQPSIRSCDNFFKLGGDSIDAMKLVSAARKEGIDISVLSIFKTPRLDQMAQTATFKADPSEVNTIPTHKPFDLLSTEIFSDFLNMHVCPQACVTKDLVEDVYPATAFQEEFLMMTMRTKNRAGSPYFNFDLNGSLDIDRLEAACRLVVKKHALLRTVFVKYNNRLIQVVLREIPVEFKRIETTTQITEILPELISKDRNRLVKLGQPLIRFKVVSAINNPDCHRFIVNISHALYDGLGLSTLWKDFRAAYEGRSLSTQPSMPAFVQAVERQNSVKGREVWRDLLQGSSMTQMVSHTNTSHRETIADKLYRNIPASSLNNHGFASTTVLKAAWSVVLAEHAGKSDVVFGYLVSGRNLPIKQISEYIGPCINLVPVRVNFQSHWKAIDLLRSVHQQQLTIMPYENVGIPEIIKECTEWPATTYFSSMVQQSSVLDFQPSGQDAFLTAPTSADATPVDCVDCWLTSTLAGDTIALQFEFNSATIPVPLASKLLDRVCEIMTKFEQDISADIPSPKTLSSLPPKIPRVCDKTECNPQLALSTQPQQCIVNEETTRSLVPSQLPHFTNEFETSRNPSPSQPQTNFDFSLRILLQDLWLEALPKVETSEPLPLDKSFYELGGDLKKGAHLVALCKRHRLDLTLNDILENPTLREQIALFGSDRRGVERSRVKKQSLTNKMKFFSFFSHFYKRRGRE